MKPSLIGLGEACVDWVAEIAHFPSPDEKIDATSESTFMGGVTANFLAGTSRLGVKSGFLGAVGDDVQGNFLLKGLADAGIDTTLVKKRGCSPVNFIMVARDSGEKVIIQSPYMQTTRLEPADIDPDYFSDARALHTTAIHGDLTLKCIDIAKKKGITVSLDLEKQISVRGMDALEPILEKVDILLPNKEGAKTLTGKSRIEDAASVLLDLGPKVVIMTLGSGGVLVTTNESQEKIPAYKVPVKDTTGAGDAFCAGFVVSHVIRGMPLEDAARFGNAVSALKIQHLGATSGLPTWDEVLEFQAKVKSSS
ncbi:MAG: carbohydrate kinase family protein [Promethearchaeota archaeon]